MEYQISKSSTRDGYRITAPLMSCTARALSFPKLGQVVLTADGLSHYITDGDFQYSLNAGSPTVCFFHDSADHTEILGKIEAAQARFSDFLSDLMKHRDYAQFWAEFEKEK